MRARYGSYGISVYCEDGSTVSFNVNITDGRHHLSVMPCILQTPSLPTSTKIVENREMGEPRARKQNLNWVASCSNLSYGVQKVSVKEVQKINVWCILQCHERECPSKPRYSKTTSVQVEVEDIKSGKGYKAMAPEAQTKNPKAK